MTAQTTMRITHREFADICSLADIEPMQAVNQTRNEGQATRLMFLTSDNGLRAPHRFMAAAGFVLDHERARWVAENIDWLRQARTQITVAGLAVMGLPTR